MVLLTSKAQILIIVSLLALPLGLLTLRMEVILFSLIILISIALDVIYFAHNTRRVEVNVWRDRIPERVIVDSIIPVKVYVEIKGFQGVVSVHDHVPDVFQITEGGTSLYARVHDNQVIELEYVFKAIVRGDHRIGPLTVILHSPLGLVGKRIDLPKNTINYIKVVPQFYAYRFKTREAIARYIMPPGGHPVRMCGLGVELEYIRNYLPGDDVRKITWKVSAKNPRRELMVKETSSEVRLSLFIVLDAGIESSLGYPRRLIDYYVEAAGSLILAALDHGDLVGLYISGTPSLLVPLTRRKEYLYMALKFLETLNPSNTRSILHRVPSVLASALPRRSIVFYFSSLENIIDVKGIAEKTRALGHKPVFMIPYTPSFIRISVDKLPLKYFYNKVLIDEINRLKQVVNELVAAEAEVVILKPVDFVSKVLKIYYSLRELA